MLGLEGKYDANPNLGSGDTLLDEYLKPAGIARYFELLNDNGQLTIASGKIAAATSVKASAINYAQATAGRQPALVANQLNGLAVADFDGVDDQLVRSAALDCTLPYSLALLFRTRMPALYQVPLGIRLNAGTQAYINITATGLIEFHHGSATTVGVPLAGADKLGWNLVIAAHAGGGLIKADINGVYQEATGDNAVPSATVPIFGALNSLLSGPFNGQAAMLSDMESDIFTIENAVARLKAQVKAAYAISF